jgi:hypothetical protein
MMATFFPGTGQALLSNQDFVDQAINSSAT